MWARRFFSAAPAEINAIGLSERMRKNLATRGIDRLFPIQSATFQPIVQGSDIVARARTGTGKTLAFAIPMIERLYQFPLDEGIKKKPRALIVCPTRELAKQVATETQSIATGLSTLPIYGSMSYVPQISALNNGVDIVVGTPGRILDLIKNQHLSLARLQTFCLDEADFMLDIGFANDIENIFAAIQLHQEDARHPSQPPLQTLLFSATLPPWVAKISEKYLRPAETHRIDLITDDVSKPLIKYVGIPCAKAYYPSLVGDLLRFHLTSPPPPSPSSPSSSSSPESTLEKSNPRAIVFTQTKQEVDDLYATLRTLSIPCAALHGDIHQLTREKTIDAFRKGTVRCLIATDVAARGLDVPNVDVVVQCGFDGRLEPFIHRSGRTGRAGKEGTNISLFEVEQMEDVLTMMRKAKIHMTVASGPRRNDVLRYAGSQLLESAPTMSPDVIALLRPFVEKLYARFHEKDDAVAACMALAMGIGQVRDRSLMTGRPGYTTVQFTPVHEKKFITRSMNTIPPLYELTGWVTHGKEQREKVTRAIREMAAAKMYLGVKKNTIVGDIQSEKLPALQAMMQGKVNIEVLDRVPMIQVPRENKTVSNNWSASHKRRHISKR